MPQPEKDNDDEEGGVSDTEIQTAKQKGQRKRTPAKTQAHAGVKKPKKTTPLVTKATRHSTHTGKGNKSGTNISQRATSKQLSAVRGCSSAQKSRRSSQAADANEGDAGDATEADEDEEAESEEGAGQTEDND